MKKWVFVLVCLLLLIGYGLRHRASDDVAVHVYLNGDDPGQAAASGEQQSLELTQAQVYRGNLVLVNKDNRVHSAGVASDIINLYEHKELVKGYGLFDRHIELSKKVAQRFARMVRAAEQEGITHFMITSGYRDEAAQRRLYREKGGDYALPAGYSEHNLGLAIDIGSTEKAMNQASEGKWLKTNAWKYGFVLRYPVDKTAITGIQFEPWHFRYVGLPHSALMYDKNLTLEEYLDYLKAQKKLKVVVDGVTYSVAYYSCTDHETISVPRGSRYDLSGDNRGGVIVTVVSS